MAGGDAITRVITKGLIGLQDLSIGTGTFTRANSTGGTITLSQINSTNLGFGFPLNVNSPVALVGSINGVNKVFTLPTAPGAICLIFRNGILQQGGGVDYTLSGSTVTFVAAPNTGNVLSSVY